MNIAENMQRRAAEAQTKLLNELLVQALERATGGPVDPYDFLNRLSRMDRPEGTTLFLDSRAILWVSMPVWTEDQPSNGIQATFNLSTNYRFLVDDCKEKPAT